jgi:transcriptional regulator GlxA family with amidase domain
MVEMQTRSAPCSPPSTAVDKRQSPGDALEQVRSLIEQQYAARLSLSRLAAHANMSRSHFSRMFKRHTGVSPRAFRV